MKTNIYIYIFVMAFATWCMRVIPSLIMRRPIENRFAKSFLHYVPYVTLAVMTFPAIVEATDQPLAGAIAFAAGIVAAWLGASLINVAVICCISVLIAEYLMMIV